LFVRLRGNVKEMERELRVPYNTVRGRLDEVIRQLGFEVAPTVNADTLAGEGKIAMDEGRRREILIHLEDGSMDANTAIEELETLKNRKGTENS